MNKSDWDAQHISYCVASLTSHSIHFNIGLPSHANELMSQDILEGTPILPLSFWLQQFSGTLVWLHIPLLLHFFMPIKPLPDE